MANVIKVKRGTSIPTTSNLANIGEFAFDYSANKLYIRSSSQVVCVNPTSDLSGYLTKKDAESTYALKSQFSLGSWEQRAIPLFYSGKLIEGPICPTTLQEKLVSGTNIKTINNNSLLGSGNISISASIPSEVAKIVGSGSSYIDIQRYGSSSYRMFIVRGTFSGSTGQSKTVYFSFSMPNATYGIFYNMNANSGYTYSASLPVTWAKTASGFTVYLPNNKTFDYVAICLI